MKSPSITQSQIFQHFIALHVSSTQKHGVDLFAIRQIIDFLIKNSFTIQLNPENDTSTLGLSYCLFNYIH